MKKTNKYIIIHKNYFNKIVKKHKKTYGYKFNHDINYDIVIRNLFVYNELFEKMILQKIKEKFKALLELAASVCEDDDASGLMLVLNETAKLKQELINKYLKYLNDKQIKLFDKKLKVIEEEVKLRIYNCNKNYHIINNMIDDEIEKKESRRR